MITDKSVPSRGYFKISKLRKLSDFRKIIFRGTYYRFLVGPLWLFALLGVLIFRKSPSTFGLNTAKYGSENIEGFLTAVERTLLKEAFQRRHVERPINKTRKIHDFLQKLKNMDLSMF